MTDRITFKCLDCGHAVMIDNDNPPNDEDVISCRGCGRKFGSYAQVREAMVAQGKAAVDELVMSKLGRKPTWTKR